MAFYGYYNCHTDDLYSIPYHSSEYNMVPTPFQASFSPSSWYEFNEPYKVSEHNYFITPSVSNYKVYTESIQHSPVERHYSDYEFDGWYVNPSETNYSVYHFIEPKLLQYDPSLSSETKSTISYSISTQEFDEPEFKEYSPDPYRGGYDPFTTYGRPLPPSDEICYPRSIPRSDVQLDGFDYGSIPSPYGKDDLDNLSTKIPITIEGTDEETDLETDVLENGVEVTGTGVQGEIGEPQPSPSDNSHYKHDDDVENGRNGDYDDNIGLRTSYGSGLEAMDLCESIFGYWPCLDKIERQQRDNFQEICDQESGRDPWKIAADYLFGSPVVYNYEHYHQISYELRK